MRRLLYVGLVLGVCQVTFARDFHIDSQKGRDSNDGATEASAWQTLENANGPNHQLFMGPLDPLTNFLKK
jgi:hypothetical protein